MKRVILNLSPSFTFVKMISCGQLVFSRYGKAQPPKGATFAFTESFFTVVESFSAVRVDIHMLSNAFCGRSHFTALHWKVSPVSLVFLPSFLSVCMLHPSTPHQLNYLCMSAIKLINLCIYINLSFEFTPWPPLEDLRAAVNQKYTLEPLCVVLRRHFASWLSPHSKRVLSLIPGSPWITNHKPLTQCSGPFRCYPTIRELDHHLTSWRSRCSSTLWCVWVFNPLPPFLSTLRIRFGIVCVFEEESCLPWLTPQPRIREL